MCFPADGLHPCGEAEMARDAEQHVGGGELRGGGQPRGHRWPLRQAPSECRDCCRATAGK